MTQRAQEIQKQRRRRTSSSQGASRKLSVTDALDTENFVYRWANDQGDRLHELTVQDDWEVVSDRSGKVKDTNTGMGTEVSVHVGIVGTGNPGRAVLLRKPKEFYHEDQREKQSRIDEKEAAMRAGSTPGTVSDNSYVPASGIQITHKG